MKQILSIENMRKSDAACIAGGVPSKELMLRAAQGIYDAASWKAPVAIVCGKGNNAGDGFALALLLYENNIDCCIFTLSDKFSDDGKYYYYDLCVSKGIDIHEYVEGLDFSSYSTIADCIFGTGFKGSPEGIFSDAIDAINKSNAYVISADINSGMNGDNGLCKTAVKSNLTVSVGGYKPGHYLNMAKDYIEDLVNVDIGIKPAMRTYSLVDREYVSKAFPKRLNFSNKGDYGYIALFGGCEKYTGAVRLAAMAACCARSGAGVVMVAAIKSLAALVGTQILESTVYPLSETCGHLLFKEIEIKGLCNRCKAIAFGMGLGLGKDQEKALDYLLKNFTGNLVIDADGITTLAALIAYDPDALKRAKCKVILTPHIKEFARLLGGNMGVEDILENPISYAENFALKNSCVVLLKGPTSVITDGINTNLSNTGCPGMATAGSGDVLSGIMASLCGYNEDTLLAASAAAYINGRAGEMAQDEYGAVSMIASDTALCVAKIIKSINIADEE